MDVSSGSSGGVVRKRSAGTFPSRRLEPWTEVSVMSRDQSGCILDGSLRFYAQELLSAMFGGNHRTVSFVVGSRALVSDRLT